MSKDQDWPWCEECRSYHHPKNPTCFRVQPKPWHDPNNTSCPYAMGQARCHCPMPELAAMLTTKQEQRLAVILGSRFPVQPPETSLPTDAEPFGRMSALFGAATTVMQNLQGEGPYATTEKIYETIKRLFVYRGEEFWKPVMGIILQYYAGHQDRAVWDATQAVYRELIRSGFNGLKRSDLGAAVGLHAPPDLQEAVEKQLIVTYYPHLQ